VTILCFADTRFPIERANGVQTMATCHALARKGHEVRLVVRPDSAASQRDPFTFYGQPPVDRLRFEYVPPPLGGGLARIRFLLAARARCGQEPDAIVFTRDLGVAAFLLRWPSLGRRVVYEAHGVTALVREELPTLLGQAALAPSRRKLRRLDRRERLVWQRSAACVTITRTLADELAARHGVRDKVFVVPDGARADLVEKGTGSAAVSARAPVAGYAGHLYPWKGVDVFVRALTHAPGVRGLIVGGHPGEMDVSRIRALADSLGVRDRLEISGLVGPAEVPARLAAATMLVLPNTASAISERYTSPLKLFEYLALRRPIVASDLPAIREVLTPGRTALLVPPGDEVALGAAMLRLAGDPALSASLGAAARALLPDYTWEARADRLDAVFEAVRR